LRPSGFGLNVRRVQDGRVPADEFELKSIAVAAFGPSVLFGLAEGAMLPVVALSAIDRGASVALASLVVSMLGIGSILSNIPAGALTTRVGERWSMVCAAAISVIGMILCLLPAGLIVFSAGVLFIGAASSVFNLARQSYLTEAVPPRMRARALSTLGGSMRVGVFVGPFLGAASMHFLGLDGAYFVALAAIIGAGVIAYRVPDLEEPHARTAPSGQKITTWGMLKRYRRVFATLGTAILLLSAIRATRQVVIPLWAAHLGMNPTTSSIIYGIAGAIDVLTFYPAGKVMDRYGRRWVAVPCMLIMGISFVLMPLTHSVLTLALVSMVMGFGNGIGSGIVMTLGADSSPAVGRPTFLGIWRELADGGSGIGPVILSAVTAISTLGVGIIVSGFVGFAAAGALWKWIPRIPRDQLDQPRRRRVDVSDARPG
jgi:MFS family permease